MATDGVSHRLLSNITICINIEKNTQYVNQKNIYEKL